MSNSARVSAHPTRSAESNRPSRCEQSGGAVPVPVLKMRAPNGSIEQLRIGGAHDALILPNATDRALVHEAEDLSGARGLRLARTDDITASTSVLPVGAYSSAPADEPCQETRQGVASNAAGERAAHVPFERISPSTAAGTTLGKENVACPNLRLRQRLEEQEQPHKDEGEINPEPCLGHSAF